MDSQQQAGTEGAAPPAEGLRLAWQAVPAPVRAVVEQWLGSPVVEAVSQASGFSPGVAARLRTRDGQRVFAKAAGPIPNPDVVAFHRREAHITTALPPVAPVPRLLWWCEDDATGWIVLVFEEIAGVHPAQPWRPDALERVLQAVAHLSALLTPAPLAPPVVGRASDAFRRTICGWQQLQSAPASEQAQLDAWSARNLCTLAALEAQAPAAVEGDSLLHFDLRADNLLLSAEHVWFVDWPHACIGAAWVDLVTFAPSVTMQGGPLPEQMLAGSPLTRVADPVALTAAVVAVAGFFTYRALQPAPPGLPTLRPFQAAQGAVARQWIATRTGLV